MGIANPYWGGGNFDSDTWNGVVNVVILTGKKYYLNGKIICEKCYEKSQTAYSKSKYHELCNACHPDHLDGKDKASGQKISCEIQKAWDNNNSRELKKYFEKHQETKSGELRRKHLGRQEIEQNNQEKIKQEKMEKERLGQNHY